MDSTKASEACQVCGTSCMIGVTCGDYSDEDLAHFSARARGPLAGAQDRATEHSNRDAMRSKPPLRVLVTGTRETLSPEAKDGVVSAIEIVLDEAFRRKRLIRFVIGDCPTGVDAWARESARALESRGDCAGVEIFEADWGTHGKAAGPRRNQAMVDSRPHLALAFPLVSASGEMSRGTGDCVRRCLAAGVRVRVYPILM